jgi:hypothetical protein
MAPYRITSYDLVPSFSPLPDYVNRFGLYRLKAINIYVIHKIRNMLFLDTLLLIAHRASVPWLSTSLSQVRRGLLPGWNCIIIETYKKLEPIANQISFRLAVETPFLLEREGGLIGGKRLETFLPIDLHERDENAVFEERN